MRHSGCESIEQVPFHFHATDLSLDSVVSLFGYFQMLNQIKSL